MDVDIDEDLQSRQMAVYGRESMKKMANARVLISGLSGLGAEVAKNVILANVKAVTLHDTANVVPADLSSHFYLGEVRLCVVQLFALLVSISNLRALPRLSQDDVGQNRAESCTARLQELNSQVQVTAATEELSNVLVAKHSIVVLINTPQAAAVE